MEVKNFDSPFISSDAVTDAVRGKHVGKHQGSRREAREKRGKQPRILLLDVRSGGKHPRELYAFIT